MDAIDFFSVLSKQVTWAEMLGLLAVLIVSLCWQTQMASSLFGQHSALILRLWNSQAGSTLVQSLKLFIIQYR